MTLGPHVGLVRSFTIQRALSARVEKSDPDIVICTERAMRIYLRTVPIQLQDSRQALFIPLITTCEGLLLPNTISEWLIGKLFS